MADAKRIAKRVLKGFGKALYYFGKGLWIVGKAIGRGIERSYQSHQEQERLRAIKRSELVEIEENNRAAGRGWTRGQADIRNEERIRRQNERDQTEYWKNLNRMYEVPQVNENAFFDEPTNRKKKRRSTFHF